MEKNYTSNEDFLNRMHEIPLIWNECEIKKLLGYCVMISERFSYNKHIVYPVKVEKILPNDRYEIKISKN